MSRPRVNILVGPYRGPCAFCDSDDARHRMVDSIAEHVRAGDPVAEVAALYGLSEAAVGVIARYAPRYRWRRFVDWLLRR